MPPETRELYRLSPRTRVLNLARTVFMLPPLERALTHVTRGRAFGSKLGKLPANYYQYPKPSMRQAVRKGIHYELDIADLVDWAIYFGFGQESKERLFSLARPGDTVLDIGTNIGEMLLTFAQKVGPSGRAIGFEPDPVNHAKCLHNLGLNSFANATLEQLALAKEEATLELVVMDERNPGMNRISTGQGAPMGAKRSQVRAVPLDHYVRSRELDRVDLIKIDVEGFEMSVLEGAEETLRRFRPKLFVEVNDAFLRGNGGSAAALVEWVRGRGYTISDASTCAGIDAGADLTDCAIDIVCAAQSG